MKRVQRQLCIRNIQELQNDYGSYQESIYRLKGKDRGSTLTGVHLLLVRSLLCGSFSLQSCIDPSCNVFIVYMLTKCFHTMCFGKLNVFIVYMLCHTMCFEKCGSIAKNVVWCGVHVSRHDVWRDTTLSKKTSRKRSRHKLWRVYTASHAILYGATTWGKVGERPRETWVAPK